MRSRRLLPSISQLTAFEAVLKTGSTAAAARALNLTQSTVSRLVQNLEKQLGQQLFHRRLQKLIATKDALTYADHIAKALNLIENASVQLTSHSDTLSLSVLPAFSSDWLVPRLADFNKAHPQIFVKLATRLKHFNFDKENFDAAIHFGEPDWRNANHMKLFDEKLTAYISTALLHEKPIKTIKDMEGLALLQLETRPKAWENWFTHQGGQSPSFKTAIIFDHFEPMMKAAMAGLGVALLPQYLAHGAMESGQLTPILKPNIDGLGSYWLVWPEKQANHPPLIAFQQWLETIVEKRSKVEKRHQ